MAPAGYTKVADGAGLRGVEANDQAKEQRSPRARNNTHGQQRGGRESAVAIRRPAGRREQAIRCSSRDWPRDAAEQHEGHGREGRIRPPSELKKQPRASRT